MANTYTAGEVGLTGAWPTDVSYVPPNVTPVYAYDGTGGQRFNLFYPKTAAGGYVPEPAGGYPCMLYILNSNFTGSTRQAAIGTLQGLIWQVLERGCAVAAIQTTPVGHANLLAGSGMGRFNPPGNVSGYFEDTSKPNAFKDVIYATQFLRYNADTYNLNPLKFGVRGNSSGSYFSGVIAGWQDWAGFLGTGGQYDVSTRVNCMYGSAGGIVGCWWHYLDPTSTNSQWFPATAGSDTAAATFANAPAGYLDAASIFNSAQKYDVDDATKYFLYAGTDSQSKVFGYPWMRGKESVNNVHSAWQAIAWKNYLPRDTTLALTDTVKIPGDMPYWLYPASLAPDEDSLEGVSGSPDTTPTGGIQANTRPGSRAVDWWMSAINNNTPRSLRDGVEGSRPSLFTPDPILTIPINRGRARSYTGFVGTTPRMVVPYNSARRYGVLIQSVSVGATPVMRYGRSRETVRSTLATSQSNTTIQGSFRQVLGPESVWLVSTTGTTEYYCEEF